MRKCKEVKYNKPSNLGILKNQIKIIKDENLLEKNMQNAYRKNPGYLQIHL